MSSWTESQLLSAIEATKNEINARLGIGSYTLSSGMGTQQVTNRSLKDLRDHLNYLESELGDLQGNGIMSVDFVRDIGGI